MTEKHQQTHKQTADVMDQLEKMVLVDPPADMTNRIMARITTPLEEGPVRRFWKVLSTPLAFSMRPVSAITCTLVLAGVFGLGRFSALPPEQTVKTDIAGQPAVFDTLETAESNYLLGRGLLLENQQEMALPLLQKAGSLEPGNPEYAYWEGVGYWSIGNREKERRSYLRGLENQPGSVPLMVNLGHTYLSEGIFDLALSAYRSVLEQEPDHAVALYNTGLIFRMTAQLENEMETWREYLKHHRTGPKAFKALERLYSYGDFSYRSFQIGARKIIVSPESLFDPALPWIERSNELRPITTILEKNPHLRLEIVVFADQAPERARNRAHIVKQLLMSAANEELGSRIGLSWLGSPQPVVAPDKTTLEIPEGLLVFSRSTSHTKEEV